MSDRLERIYHLQEVLNSMMPPRANFARWYLGQSDPDAATCVTKEVMLAIDDEVSEIRRELNWKPWKQRDPVKPDIARVHNEIVDLMHFVIDLAITWGLTPPRMSELFELKHRENVDRQVRGY